VSGQIHALAALSPGKQPLVPIVQEAGWAPEPVWTTWRSENSWPYLDSNSDPPVIQPIASCYTDCAIPAPTRWWWWWWWWETRNSLIPVIMLAYPFRFDLLCSGCTVFMNILLALFSHCHVDMDRCDDDKCVNRFSSSYFPQSELESEFASSAASWAQTYVFSSLGFSLFAP
jgi:hypothetical protein